MHLSERTLKTRSLIPCHSSALADSARSIKPSHVGEEDGHLSGLALEGGRGLKDLLDDVLRRVGPYVGRSRQFPDSASAFPARKNARPPQAVTPHEGQVTAGPAAQWTQNFWPALFSCLQDGQNILPPPRRPALDQG